MKKRKVHCSSIGLDLTPVYQMRGILTKLSIKSRKMLNVSILLSVCSITTITQLIKLHL